MVRGVAALTAEHGLGWLGEKMPVDPENMTRAGKCRWAATSSGTGVYALPRCGLSAAHGHGMHFEQASDARFKT